MTEQADWVPFDIIHIQDIKTDDRMRTDLGDVEALANSIERLGIIHPIVIEKRSQLLVAGGRRLAAFKHLKRETLQHGKDFIWHDEMSADLRKEVELEENVRRKDMTWQERCLAIDDIHKLKQRLAALDRESWGLVETGELLGMSAANVSYNTTVAKSLREKDSPVKDCSNFTEALKLLMKVKEEEAQKLLSKSIVNISRSNPLVAQLLDDARAGKAPTSDGPTAVGQPADGETLSFADFMKGIGADPDKPAPGTRVMDKESGEMAPVTDETTIIPLSRMLHHGDGIKFMNEVLTPESIDHIVTDPPYGIDMEMLEQEGTGMTGIADVVKEHDVEQNIDLLLNRFLPAAWRVLKDKGFCVMWYDMDHHEKLRDRAVKLGFKVQRWPLTWVKMHRCINQAAQYNFTKATEVAMVLRKGNATLVKPQDTNFIVCANNEKDVWKHAFAKPSKVWEWIYDAIAYKGQTVLDPFAGVGSSVQTAVTKNLTPFAAEINEVHYSKMVDNVSRWYKLMLNVKVKFA